MTRDRPLSKDLERWLTNTSSAKNVANLTRTFREKSFAIALLLLLFPSALPLPTGGITNVFEILAMIISAQLIAGRTTIWLPRRWRDKEVGAYTKTTVVPKLIAFLRYAERYSRHNLEAFLNKTYNLRVTGGVLLIFTVAAFAAPPFSGLDTLPSLAVVLIASAMLVEDILIFVSGIIVGTIGSLLIAWLWPTILRSVL